MINLLSAEWYKLVRSKSFSICIAVVVCAVALMYGVLSLMVEAREEFSMMELTCQIFSGDLMPCVLAIFVSIFVTGEYESGMMKNVVGKGRERRKIFLSKLIVTELAVIPLILAGIGAGLLGGLWFKGSGAFTVDFWKNFGVYAGLQLLMEIALAGVFVLSSNLCRNYAAGISLGIGISAFPMLIMEGADLWLKKREVSISGFWLVNRSVHCPYEGFTAGYVLETLLVALFWLVLSAGLGIWHFSRADIK